MTGTNPDTGSVDSRDFTAAYEDLWRAAYRVAFRLLGSQESAADCAQESCVRACQRWKRLIRHGDPTPWVVRVASNLAIDHWRRDRRPLASRQASTVDETAIAARLDLHAALGQLPRRQRQVVVLRWLADMTESQTAAVLGISPGAVKQHASRGLTALRLALGAPEVTE